MNVRASWIVLAAAVLAVPGCKPDNNARVTVNYKQVANFADYRLAPDASGSFGAGEGMFVMYKVTTISNTGSQAKAFTFDPHHVVTVTPDKTSNETINDGPTLLLNQNLTTVSVPAGQTVTVNKCFIKQALTPNPQSLANTSAHVGVLYQFDSSQPVSMHDLAPNGSITLVSNALPNPLQSLCSGA